MVFGYRVNEGLEWLLWKGYYREASLLTGCGGVDYAAVSSVLSSSPPCLPSM